MAKTIDIAGLSNNLYVEGRHLGDRPLLTRNIVSNVSCYHYGATIRLDDKENLAWWLQIFLSKGQLKQISQDVEGMEAGQLLRDFATKMLGVLRHKDIYPPMNPGIQEALEQECLAAIAAFDNIA